jgi:hypothetical protein
MPAIDWNAVGQVAEPPPAAPQGAPQGAIDWGSVNAAMNVAPTQAPAAPAAPTVTGNAANGSVGAGVMQGIYDSGNGPAQLLYNALPKGARAGLTQADHWLYDHTGGMMGVAPGQDLNSGIAKQNAQYEADRAAAGRTGMDWARLGGGVAGSAPLAVATGGGSAGGLLATTLRGAGAGALSGALQPVTNGGENYWTDKGKQAVIGALTGGVTGPAAAIIGPKLAKAQQLLVDSGMTLTPGQLLGGAAKRAEDALTSVPVLGDLIKNAQRRSFEDLNTAAINRSVAPIGQSLPAGVSGREAIAYADKAISDAYNSTLTKIGSVQPDAQFGADMQGLAGMLQNLPKDKGQQFVNILKNEVADRIDGNGMMTAEGFKAADSNIGQLARGYLRSNDYDTSQMGAALLQAQQSLRQMLQRTAPPNLSQDLANANTAFANFLRPQRASASLGADGGVFTPEQLQSAVKALDQSKRKSSFSTGGALMQDLSEAAKTAMGNKVPDSGTPLRHAWGLAAGALAGHAVAPAAVGPAALAAAVTALPYTAIGAKATQALIAKRPDSLRMLADLLRQNAAPIGAVSAPALVSASQP